MFYYTAGRLILPLLIQCILNSLVQNGLHHCDICMRNCSRAQCAGVSICFERFLDNCQDDSPTARWLFLHFSMDNSPCRKQIVARAKVDPKGWANYERVLLFIWKCKSVLIKADGLLCVPACCTYWCVCAQRVSLTCHLAVWRCSRTPGSAEKTRWLQSAASRLLWGPDPGWLTPGCVGKQTQKGLSKQTMPAGVNTRPRHQRC